MSPFNKSVPYEILGIPYTELSNRDPNVHHVNFNIRGALEKLVFSLENIENWSVIFYSFLKMVFSKKKKIKTMNKQRSLLVYERSCYNAQR